MKIRYNYSRIAQANQNIKLLYSWLEFFFNPCGYVYINNNDNPEIILKLQFIW